MADKVYQDTPRRTTGYDGAPISGTIVNREDPLHLGRVQIAAADHDPSQIREEDLPWAFIQSPGPQSYVGSTKHADNGFFLNGMTVLIQRNPDGTSHIISQPTQMSGPPAPMGGTAQQGQPTYPGNMYR